MLGTILLAAALTTPIQSETPWIFGVIGKTIEDVPHARFGVLDSKNYGATFPGIVPFEEIGLLKTESDALKFKVPFVLKSAWFKPEGSEESGTLNMVVLEDGRAVEAQVSGGGQRYPWSKGLEKDLGVRLDDIEYKVLGSGNLVDVSVRGKWAETDGSVLRINQYTMSDEKGLLFILTYRVEKEGRVQTPSSPGIPVSLTATKDGKISSLWTSKENTTPDDLLASCGIAPASVKREEAKAEEWMSADEKRWSLTFTAGLLSGRTASMSYNSSSKSGSISMSIAPNA